MSRHTQVFLAEDYDVRVLLKPESDKIRGQLMGHLSFPQFNRRKKAIPMCFCPKIMIFESS